MAEADVYARIADLRIVPVLSVESVDAALPLADALIAGGLPIAEITFRTQAAADVIRLLSAQRPDLLVGAGTVTRPNRPIPPSSVAPPSPLPRGSTPTSCGLPGRSVYPSPPA